MTFLSKIKGLFVKEGAAEPLSFKQAIVNQTIDGYEMYDASTLQWLGTFPYRYAYEKYGEDNGYIIFD